MLEIAKYPKINGIFKRDKNGNFIVGDYVSPEVEYLKRNKFRWSEKIHGCNIRIHFENGKIILRGRTDRAEIPIFLEEKLRTLFPSYLSDHPLTEKLTLFGEGFGKRIQKEGILYNKDDVDFILFDALCNGRQLEFSEVNDVAEYLSIKSVPVVGVYDLPTMIGMIRSGSLMSAFGSFRAEGVVGVPTVPVMDRYGRRIQVKIKSCDFGFGMRLEG